MNNNLRVLSEEVEALAKLAEDFTLEVHRLRVLLAGMESGKTSVTARHRNSGRPRKRGRPTDPLALHRRLHQLLLTKGEEGLHYTDVYDLAKKAKMWTGGQKSKASILTALASHKGLFRKVGPGTYRALPM